MKESSLFAKEKAKEINLKFKKIEKYPCSLMHAVSHNQILPLESCASGLIWSVSLLNRTHPYPGYGPVPLWLVQPPNPAMSTCD